MQVESLEPLQDLEHPIRNGNRFENPKSFNNWTGLPSLRDIFGWVLTRKRSNIPSEQVYHYVICKFLHFTVIIKLGARQDITNPTSIIRRTPDNRHDRHLARSCYNARDNRQCHIHHRSYMGGVRIANMGIRTATLSTSGVRNRWITTGVYRSIDIQLIIYSDTFRSHFA